MNTAWMLACSREALAFHHAVRRVEHPQRRLLQELLWQNRDTEFGRRHHFDRIRTPAEYQKQVPLSTYEDYSAAVEQIAASRCNVLTREPVLLLQPTSGSTGGEKLIPYTASLRRQFQRGIAAWIADLFHHRPAVRTGRAYWSISPALGPPRRARGRLPIGFDDDTAYLGLVERLAVSRLLAAPPSVAHIADIDSFRRATLSHLLRAADLSLISIWNPTFLTALLQPIEEWLERLCSEMRPADPARADMLLSIWRNGGSQADRIRATWPNLRLISCWTDAAAGQYVPALQELFPAVEIQPKGLIATEAMVSFPLVGQPGSALSLRSHFFEFEEIGGPCRLAHELQRGGRYRVIVSTAGGLYRYQLRDEVDIVGFVHRCPLLRFVGKADLVSDLVGEKLAEPFVRAALEGLWQGTRPGFALLVPVRGNPPRYRLHVEGVVDVAILQGELQTALEENPHYRYACGLGQLAPVEVQRVADGEGWRLYERGCLARGQKLGDIKPVALDPRPGWGELS
jgi:hypothetical protein